MTKTAFMQLRADPTFMKARNTITHLPHRHLKDRPPVLSVVVAQQRHVRQEQLLHLQRWRLFIFCASNFSVWLWIAVLRL